LNSTLKKFLTVFSRSGLWVKEFAQATNIALTGGYRTRSKNSPNFPIVKTRLFFAYILLFVSKTERYGLMDLAA